MRIKGEYRDVLSKDGEVIKDTGWKSNAIVEDYGRFLAALMKKDFEGDVGIDYMAVGSGSDKDYTVFKNRVEEFFKFGRYLFCWDSVPGDDSEEERLKRYLEDDHDIVTENAVITKQDDNKIQIIEDENLLAKLTLVDEEKATLEITSDGTHDLKVKKENGKRNIYSGSRNLPHKPESEDYWVWAKEIIVDSDIKYLPEDSGITNKLQIDVTFKKEDEEGEAEPSEETLDFKEFALLGIDKKEGNLDTAKMFFINHVDHEVIRKDKSMELSRTVILRFPLEEEEEEEVS